MQYFNDIVKYAADNNLPSVQKNKACRGDYYILRIIRRFHIFASSQPTRTRRIPSKLQNYNKKQLVICIAFTKHKPMYYIYMYIVIMPTKLCSKNLKAQLVFIFIAVDGPTLAPSMLSHTWVFCHLDLLRRSKSRPTSKTPPASIPLIRHPPIRLVGLPSSDTSPHNTYLQGGGVLKEKEKRDRPLCA